MAGALPFPVFGVVSESDNLHIQKLAKRRFGMEKTSGKKFYPVIHCIDPYYKNGIGHAIRNTSLAIENGADGVFLIGHGMEYVELLYIYENVRKQFPKVWIGINFLDVSHDTIFHGASFCFDWSRLSHVAKKCENLNALWIDAMPDERLSLSSIQIFGGVAFKYLSPHLSGAPLAAACERAIQCVDVATTSGDKTGSAPNVKKLESIKGHLDGRIPLALASGVSSNNVHEFLETVDIFLVASSICERNPNLGNEEYLVPEKVRKLAELIHE